MIHVIEKEIVSLFVCLPLKPAMLEIVLHSLQIWKNEIMNSDST